MRHRKTTDTIEPEVGTGVCNYGFWSCIFHFPSGNVSFVPSGISYAAFAGWFGVFGGSLRDGQSLDGHTYYGHVTYGQVIGGHIVNSFLADEFSRS